MFARRIGPWLCVPVLLAVCGRADAGIMVPLRPVVPLEPRDVYSTNQAFVLAVNGSEAGSPVYATADRTRPLWVLPGVLKSNWGHLLLSDDGAGVALVWAGSTAELDAEGVRVVNRDGLAASYRLGELYSPPASDDGVFAFGCGPPSPPWVTGVTNEGDRFLIQTTDGRNLRFSYTGEVVRRDHLVWALVAVVVLGIGGVFVIANRVSRVRV